MKILMLCDSMDCGGAETHILTLSASLVLCGHEVCVASSGGRLVSALCKAGVRHVTLPFGARSPLSLLSCRIALERLLAREKFDIVHAHSRLAAFLAHNVIKRHGIAFAVTAHAYFSLSPLRRRLSRWGDATIAVSEDIKQYLVKNYHLLPNRVTVIENGVDEKIFCPSSSPTYVPTAPKIVFLSRLDGDCSLGAYLLCDITEDIAQRYPDASVIIGGAGSEFEAVSKEASRVNRKLDREFIKCAGQINDVALFLRSADIFVGVSRAAIEAGMSALPVILCGNEGFFGLLTPQNFGRAAASNFTARKSRAADAALLRDELFALLDRQHSEIRRDIEQVRALFLSDHSLSGFTEATEKVYKSISHAKKQKKCDSLLCGYYGFGNIGDDALLAASLRRARREYPDRDIAIMTKNGKRDTATFGARCIRRASPLAVLFALSRAKRLIFGGGTLLQSSTSRRSLLYTVREGDFLRLLLDMGMPELSALEGVPLLQIVRSDNPAVNVTAPLETLLERIQDNNFVPVVDDRGCFIGIVTRKAIIGHFACNYLYSN